LFLPEQFAKGKKPKGKNQSLPLGHGTRLIRLIRAGVDEGEAAADPRNHADMT
jgi:hypothetical protein